ncbi:MAG: DUF58 domain-containing protein [Clostridia bacterium]|nr:DUF58 domain-containing protein [Clostridia bacterium]
MKIIIWTIFTAVMGFLAVFYNNEPLCMLTLLMGIMPIVSLIVLILRRITMRLKLSAEDMTVNFGEGIKAKLILYGLPLLSQPEFDCRIRIRNLLTDKESDMIVPIKRSFLSISSVTIANVVPDECGMVEISLSPSKLRDSLGLFSFRVFKKANSVSAVITVLPKITDIPVKISGSTANYFSNTEAYSTEKPGDDPSEVFDTREYRAGDSLRAIHWKQTARTGELVVKEFGLPIESSAAIIYNCTDNLSDCMNFITSLSLALLNEECPHKIYYKIKDEETHTFITKEDDLSAILPTLLSSKPQLADFDNIKEAFVCEVREGGRVLVNGDDVCDVFDKYMPIIEVKGAES